MVAVQSVSSKPAAPPSGVSMATGIPLESAWKSSSVGAPTSVFRAPDASAVASEVRTWSLPVKESVTGALAAKPEPVIAIVSCPET